MSKMQANRKSRVLEAGFKTSSNFYDSDLIFQNLLSTEISDEGATYMGPKWLKLGKEAAGRLSELSLIADQNPPVLVKRNFYGETVNEIRFNAAYQEMLGIAVESEMLRVKWHPELRKRFAPELHRLGFASGFLFTLAENGLYCPLCMTDGAARLIDRYCDAEDQKHLLPRIYTQHAKELYTGAMFITEKSGGSDVGALVCEADHAEGMFYKLNGEKWFCSNANAEIIFTLARTNPDVTGTKGLSIFLVEKHNVFAKKNYWEVVRLKDKLGVRSMASAECIFTDTYGKMVGREGEGFKLMSDMINISRVYNAMSAVGMTRRALIEAYQFLFFRKTFGKEALDHPLIREKLADLSAGYLANFYMTWRCIRALDLSDQKDQQETDLMRLLIPMVKRSTAAYSVYAIRECMELMGGMGYIEDGIMPKFMRDAMVLPIWEGAGNVMLLDMLRACQKSEGLEAIITEISWQLPKADWGHQILMRHTEEVLQTSKNILKHEPETMEAFAKPFFEKLTSLYQIATLLSYKNRDSERWILPAVERLTRAMEGGPLKPTAPVSRAEMERMMGWQF